MNNDTPWRRDKIESPCVNICVINRETKLCTGCARTTDEIASWSIMSPDERRAVMDDLPKREAAPKHRRRLRHRSR
jgi:predicted Fe-S protein YdhL (DUF1289 family)